MKGLKELPARGAGVLIALGLSLVASGAACGANPAPVVAGSSSVAREAPASANRQAEWREKLAAAETLWAAAKVEAYQYTIRVLCFCPQEITRPNIILVAGGIGRLQVPSGAAVSTFLEQYNTVDKLFAIARTAIDRRAFRLTLAFDPQFGVPTLIDVDYQEMTADDELRIVVSDFKVAGARK
jgi:hypothetical protein